MLLVFQITWNRTERDAKLVGLRRISKLVLPSDVRVHLVAVTPESVRPKITVPKEYFENQGEKADEDMDEDEDMCKGGDVDGDEAVDEEGEATDGEQDDGTNKELWEFFPVFHCPINMDELFRPQHLSPSRYRREDD